jgi:sugar (pentulose or hexulose) kinase
VQPHPRDARRQGALADPGGRDRRDPGGRARRRVAGSDLGARELRALVGIDIGATSIKVGAFDEHGELLALATRANAPVVQDAARGWFAWDAERLWADVASALREATAGVEPVGVAVTGFGADGAPFSVDGTQRYPVISWHDARAEDELAAIVESVGERRLYELTGYHAYPINTLCRWSWLRRNAPEALEGTRWLMVPDIVAFRLTGEQRGDPTEASTQMAFDLAARDYSAELLAEAGVSPELLPPLVAPGGVVGHVTAEAAEATGLPAGIPVCAAGHDGETAAFAAGDLPDGTALDISGTWELVMLRHERFEPTDEFFAAGIDWEVDAVPGRFLCVALMPSGSVVNWVRDLAYDASGWDAIVAEAQAAPVGAHGVRVVPAFVRGMGPYARRPQGGSIEGLQTTSTRADLARATFEGLCFQLRAQLRVLGRLHQRPVDRLRVTGGAQRNPFWLQLKADTTGCACEAVPHEELTLLGAALLAGVGAGVYASFDEALAAAARPPRTIEPDAATAAAYDELFAPLEPERVA